MDDVELVVRFAGATHAVRLPRDARVAELQERLLALTGVAPFAQKLVFKGGQLAAAVAAERTLAECGLADAGKVMLVGSSEADVKQTQASLAAAAERDAELQRRQRRQPRAAVASRAPPSADELAYRFHRVEVLPDLPEQDKARALLQRLADDLGIRGLLKAHKWSIGTLRELSPLEHTILGYNRNRGQEIALRLRTDNFRGFRYYDTIRKVLLHELAHMVHDEHNNDFHRFNRELTNEAARLDWTRSGGARVGGSGETPYEPGAEESVDSDALQGGSYRLGGDHRKLESRSKRELLLEAATLRLTVEEQEITDSCSGAGTWSER